MKKSDIMSPWPTSLIVKLYYMRANKLNDYAYKVRYSEPKSNPWQRLITLIITDHDHSSHIYMQA